MLLTDIALFLLAAVVAVPLFKRLRLGAVLGYLAAGIVIGPWGLGLITGVDRILQVSEFGVVLLLFVIGLELQISRLRLLRNAVFGLGGAQVLLTTAILAGLAHVNGWSLTTSLVIGFGLSMSSTALVLQLLSERSELVSRHGRAGFGMLLFQDLAVIPFLAVLPMLAGHHSGVKWASVAEVLVALTTLVIVGRYLLRPVFRMLAAAQVPEIFTAAALLLVVGTALAMEVVGLSASLGAFIAGLLLADSEYRHELQADIEPFKGLLLGLFFIAVGMSADLGLLTQRPLEVLVLVVVLIGVKAAVLFVVGRVGRLPKDSAVSLAAALSQGGEFAFVLFNLAGSAGVLTPELRNLLILAVTLSMLVTPPIYALVVWMRRAESAPPYDEIDVPASPVIIAGFGAFGQIVGRILRVKKIAFTVLENNAQHVDFVRRFGGRIFYSDASRAEVLRAARADQASLFVLAIADEEASLRVARTVRALYPQLRIFAIARTRIHQMKLMDLGLTDVVRRSYGSSLEMAQTLLMVLGESEDVARGAIDIFRRHDESTLARQHAVYRDEQKMIQTAREAAEELEHLFESDSVSVDRTP